MDLKTAYDILEIRKNATEEEMEDKYLLWIRKAKAQANNNKTKEAIDLNKINDAYNTIKQHFQEQKDLANPSKNKPKHPIIEKIDHFFYHYKLHFFGALFVIIFVGSLLHAFITNKIEENRLANLPPADIEIIIYGDYFIEDITRIEEKLEATFPQWEDIRMDFLHGPIELRSEMDMASLQANQVRLMNENPDFFILDAHHFGLLVTQAAYLPLNEYEQEIKEFINEDRLLYYQEEETNENYLYGINISGSELFEEVGFRGEQKIVALRFDTENVDNVLEFLEKSAESLTDSN
ncbi:hypothetical protein ACERII_07565 [Evansella sp. AB-rgal1]|uniref:hypothetical protein n=1 Tax=Evansella sp. AB-rgal1 TaxID=3242696 RepID=UPI00359DF39A